MPNISELYFAKNCYRWPAAGFCILVLCYIPVRAVTGFTPSIRQTAALFIILIPLFAISFLYSALFAIKHPQMAMNHDFFYHGYLPIHKFNYDVITPETERWWRLYVVLITLISLAFLGFWFLSFAAFLIYGPATSVGAIPAPSIRVMTENSFITA